MTSHGEASFQGREKPQVKAFDFESSVLFLRFLFRFKNQNRLVTETSRICFGGIELIGFGIIEISGYACVLNFLFVVFSAQGHP